MTTRVPSSLKFVLGDRRFGGTATNLCATRGRGQRGERDIRHYGSTCVKCGRGTAAWFHFNAGHDVDCLRALQRPVPLVPGPSKMFYKKNHQCQKLQLGLEPLVHPAHRKIEH